MTITQNKTKQAKITIRQNVWGNWYGYRSGRRVESFFNSAEESQEQAAQRWLREQLAAQALKCAHGCAAGFEFDDEHEPFCTNCGLYVNQPKRQVRKAEQFALRLRARRGRSSNV